MPIEINYKPAKICRGASEWYVYFKYQDQLTKKWMPPVKDRGGLNYIKDLKERNKLAEELKDAYNVRLKGGWLPNQDNVNSSYESFKNKPIRELFERFYKIKSGSVNPDSLVTYRSIALAFVEWVDFASLKHLSIEHISEIHIQKFLDYAISIKGDDGKFRFKNTSVNNIIIVMRMFFNMAIKRKIITDNPFSEVDFLSEESGKNYAFGAFQKTQILQAILKYDPDLLLFVKALYHFLIRPKELLSIQLKDVNLTTMQIMVDSVFAKNNEQRAIVIPDCFAEEIRALRLNHYPQHYYLFGYDLKICDSSYSRSSVTRRHSAALHTLSIDTTKYTMYGWKHTGNVDSFVAGVSIYDLMRQNGHKSIEQTETYLRSLGCVPNIGYSSKAPALVVPTLHNAGYGEEGDK